MTLLHVLDERPVDGKRLGRHIHLDPRSRNFPAVELVAPDMPVASKLWRFPGKPLNQGDLGSCTGNAATHLLRVRRGRANGLDEKTARKVYSAATELDGISGAWPPTDTGSSGLAALKAAQQLGLFTGPYRWCFGLTDVLQVLSQHGAAIVGVPWYEGFDQPASDGLLSIAGSVRGGHELCLHGVQVENSRVRGVNSWGADWGDHGDFDWTWNTLDRLLHEHGDAATIA